METRTLKLADIHPSEYNPRFRFTKKDFEYSALAKSIDEYGLVVPLLVNTRNMTLISGHQRFWIMQDRGEEEADCVVVDLDEAQERALCIAMNKVSGEWDYGLLADLLEEIREAGIDTDMTGFREFEISDILGELEDEQSDIDLERGKTPKKEDKKDGLVCLVGEYKFRIPDELWEATIADIRLKVGFTKEKVIEELQRRLYRDEDSEA